jgi:hypothetical protein
LRAFIVRSPYRDFVDRCFQQAVELVLGVKTAKRSSPHPYG